MEKIIGQRLKEIRKLKGYTQKEIIDKANLDVTQQVFSKYESGGVRIPSSTLYLLSNALDVDMNSFFPGRKKRGNVSDELINKTLSTIREDAVKMLLSIESAQKTMGVI